MTVYTLAWLVALLPLLGWLFSYIAVTPRRSAQIGMAFCLLGLALAAFVLAFRLTHRADAAYESVITFWDVHPSESAVFAPTLTPMFGVRVDALSAVFMTAVAFVGLVVQWHGMALMRGDVEMRRFYQVAGVFTFAALAVVVSPNLFQFWLMGEVAAVCAYLLAVHWWTSPAVAAGARRMFLYLRCGDLVLLLAIVFAYIKLGRHATALPPASGADLSDPLSFAVLGGEWPVAHAGGVPGVGMRTLAVLAVLLLLAGSVRALQLLFHVWLVDAAAGPPVAVALLASVLAATGVLLLARVYPLFLEVPHMLTALAVCGAVTAVFGALAALVQRDLMRLAILIATAQLGLVVAALGLGGYGRSLFALLAQLLLTPLLLMVITNIARVYRTEEIAEIRGMWPRMRWSSVGLGLWAAGMAGGSLVNYNVLASAFQNRAPRGTHLGAPARAAVVVALLVAMVMVAGCALRLAASLSRGEPLRRRGVQPERIVEAEPRMRRGVAVLTVVSLVVLLGAAVPRFSFSRFVFSGDQPQPLSWDPAATAASLAVALIGAAVAWAAVTGLTARVGPAAAQSRRLGGRAAAWLDLAPWTARLVAAPLLIAGRAVGSGDRAIVGGVGDAVGEGVDTLAGGPERLLSARLGRQLTVAVAGILLLVLAAVLAATGHLAVRSS